MIGFSKCGNVEGVLPKGHAALSRCFCEAQAVDFSNKFGASQKRRYTQIVEIRFGQQALEKPLKNQ
jgi:hypothetical protein